MKLTSTDIGKGLDYYKDYVLERAEVEKVLNELNIEFNHIRTKKNGSNAYIIVVNGQEFDYTEGSGHDKVTAKNVGAKVISALHSLIVDEWYSQFNLDELALESGITKPTEAFKLWLDLQENSKKLHEALSDDSIDLLKTNLEL
jgi:hypothetical protein